MVTVFLPYLLLVGPLSYSVGGHVFFPNHVDYILHQLHALSGWGVLLLKGPSRTVFSTDSDAIVFYYPVLNLLRIVIQYSKYSDSLHILFLGAGVSKTTSFTVLFWAPPP